MLWLDPRNKHLNASVPQNAKITCTQGAWAAIINIQGACQVYPDVIRHEYRTGTNGKCLLDGGGRVEGLSPHIVKESPRRDAHISTVTLRGAWPYRVI